MRYLVSLLIAAAVTLCGFQSFAGAGGGVGEKFVHTVYLKGTATGGNGSSYSSPKPFVDGDLWAIPAGTVIEKVYVIIDTAITGTTVLEVGDDDDPNGFVLDQAANFATPGMYGWDVKAAGADLKITTAGATDALDIYTVPSAKYYSATGKEVKLNITTANTAGRMRVVIEGYRAGTK
jgi:hypothetical protein